MKAKQNTKRDGVAARGPAVGFSLVELMVAMTIGLVLIAGASKVYLEGRKNYDNNETIARMQESARYAMSVVENDIRMANNWGQKAGTGGLTILVPMNTAADNCVKSIDQAAGMPIMLQAPMQGTNNTYLLAPFNGTCTAYSAAVTTADTLTIFRNAVGNSGGSWHVCSRAAKATLIDTVGCPAGFADDDFLIHSYYVDTKSAQGRVPSLRRHALIAGPAMQDQEIIPGIEDMQIQFGIDPNNTDPANVTMYVNPDQLPVDARVLSVRVWFLVREDLPEFNFYDTTPYYEYGDRLHANGDTADLTDPTGAGKAYKPSATGDTSTTSIVHFRRLLVSKTIQPRNLTQ